MNLNKGTLRDLVIYNSDSIWSLLIVKVHTSESERIPYITVWLQWFKPFREQIA